MIQWVTDDATGLTDAGFGLWIAIAVIIGVIATVIYYRFSD